MTPVQAKGARNLLGWSRERLGAMSGTSANTISAYERYGHLTRAISGASGIDQLAAIQATLEAAGIVFIKGNRAGPEGVRLHKTGA